MVQNNFKQSKSDFYHVKMHLAHQSHQSSTINKLAEFLGFTPDGKLVGQQYPTNQCERNDLNHHEITHTKELQRSRYIEVDSNIIDNHRLNTRNKNRTQRSRTAVLDLNGYTEIHRTPGEDKIELTYTKESVVRERRKKTL